MPRGASPKREREYRGLKHKFAEEGRYKGREEEVAARIVNKQRAQYGETQEEQVQQKQGKSPDQYLPMPHYEHLTVDQVAGQLDSLTCRDMQQIRDYETKHKHRKTLLEALERKLQEEQ